MNVNEIIENAKSKCIIGKDFELRDNDNRRITTYKNLLKHIGAYKHSIKKMSTEDKAILSKNIFRVAINGKAYLMLK